MKTKRNHRAGAGQHAHAARGDDCYETPACAVEALLKVEPLPHVLWEPACGPGAIKRVLSDHGHTVLTSDIVKYPGAAKLDFLSIEQEQPLSSISCIITNPPYMLAAQFVRRALKLAPKVVMLLRLAFLESIGRNDILDNGQLARVYVFRNRLPMMHRAGWTGPKASSSICYAWFVWVHNHVGPATIQRISWEA